VKSNPNHRGQYRDVPLFVAIQQGNCEETDLLLQYNADLDIPEADGLTPRKVFPSGGPKIAAVVQRHIQKREGKEEAPRTEKRCDNCKKTDVPLRNCSKCQVARYCNVECQSEYNRLLHPVVLTCDCRNLGAAWPTHKKTCQPFGTLNTATFKPHYEQNVFNMPSAQVRRNILGMPSEPVTSVQNRGAHVPKDVWSEGQVKSIVIKVQVPLEDSKAPLFVYNKKRDFVCMLRHQDQPESYERVSKIVREKGVGGQKAYFAAELKSKDELVIKVSEILAAQPF
jgi:hypothetical protein